MKVVDTIVYRYTLENCKDVNAEILLCSNKIDTQFIANETTFLFEKQLINRIVIKAVVNKTRIFSFNELYGFQIKDDVFTIISAFIKKISNRVISSADLLAFKEDYTKWIKKAHSESLKEVQQNLVANNEYSISNIIFKFNMTDFAYSLLQYTDIKNSIIKIITSKGFSIKVKSFVIDQVNKVNFGALDTFEEFKNCISQFDDKIDASVIANYLISELIFSKDLDLKALEKLATDLKGNIKSMQEYIDAFEASKEYKRYKKGDSTLDIEYMKETEIRLNDKLRENRRNHEPLFRVIQDALTDFFLQG